MEFVATLIDQVSPGAETATASLLKMKTAATEASSALQAFTNNQKSAKTSVKEATSVFDKMGATITKGAGIAKSALGSLFGKIKGSSVFQWFSGMASKAGSVLARVFGGAAGKVGGFFSGLKNWFTSSKEGSTSWASKIGKAGKAASAALSAGGTVAKNVGSSIMSKIGPAMKGYAQALAAVAIAIAVVAAAAVKFLGPIVMGEKGMEALSKIGEKASKNFKKLFDGVDTTPVLRAFEKLASIVDGTTVTGRVMGETLNRAVKGVFGLLESAQPYVTAFAQGLIYGFLIVENAVLKARIAMLPFTSTLETLAGDGTLLSGVFYATAYSLVAIVAAVGVLLSPFIFLAETVAEVYVGFVKLYNFLSGAPPEVIAPKVEVPDTAALAKANGVDIGKGMTDGMLSQLGSIKAAGAQMAQAADAGTKAAAQIKSPSRLFKGSGSFMGQGLTLGIESEKDNIQSAAEKSFVPDVNKAVTPFSSTVNNNNSSTTSTAGPSFVFSGSIVINGEDKSDSQDFQSMVEDAMFISLQKTIRTLGGNT